MHQCDMDGEGAVGRGGRLAWAAGLEGSVRGLYSYLGWPQDSAHHNAKQHHKVSWEAAAAFSAGLVALAEEAERHGLSWSQVVALARDEQREIELHLTQLGTADDRGTAD